MKEDTKQPFEVVGDHPLEARVVAWVLGEASPFEAEELARLCGEMPELEVFRRRIEAVHGLAAEALKPRTGDWSLPEGKRAKVFASIGSVEIQQRRERTSRWASRRAMWMLAACLVLTAIVAALVFPMFVLMGGKSAAPTRKTESFFSFQSAQEAPAVASGPAGEHWESANVKSESAPPISERLAGRRLLRTEERLAESEKRSGESAQRIDTTRLLDVNPQPRIIRSSDLSKSAATPPPPAAPARGAAPAAPGLSRETGAAVTRDQELHERTAVAGKPVAPAEQPAPAGEPAPRPTRGLALDDVSGLAGEAKEEELDATTATRARDGRDGSWARDSKMAEAVTGPAEPAAGPPQAPASRSAAAKAIAANTSTPAAVPVPETAVPASTRER